VVSGNSGQAESVPCPANTRRSSGAAIVSGGGCRCLAKVKCLLPVGGADHVDVVHAPSSIRPSRSSDGKLGAIVPPRSATTALVVGVTSVAFGGTAEVRRASRDRPSHQQGELVPLAFLCGL
jgi:hypothetical protein